MQQGRAELGTIARRLESQYPDSNGDVGVSFLPLHEYIVGDVRPVLLVLLALVGGVLGLLLAVLAVPSLLALSPQDIRQFKQIGINREVLAFTFLASVVCGVLFGLIPALQSSRSRPNEFLKEGE